MKKLLSVLVATLLLAGAAQAEERATPQDAEELVKTAVAYLKKHGAEKAYKEFQNKSGPFIYKDLYVYVTDMEGLVLAHGADPARVGKNFAAIKDVDGKPFMAERLEAGKSKASFWTEYKFKNPANGKIEPKTVYTERSGDLLLSAGAYKP